MKTIPATSITEAQVLAQTLQRDLFALTISLKGRLSPQEEQLLTNLAQDQVNLQTILTDVAATSVELFPSVGGAASVSEADNTVYAQAMQYARDLVKAIRQKKEHQRRLELTSQQLIRAEKLATVGRVAATVAHELNNIVTPLLMYAKLIQDEAEGDDKAEIAEYAGQITTIATRASDMLRQLVDASRPESATPIPVDLSRVIDNALNLLSPRLNKQKIRIEERYPHSFPLVLGNPSQLEQVFINIALNAFDAMPDGGDFIVSINPPERQEDSLGEVNFVSVHLSDTGQGIASEHLMNIFEPFFTTKARGAGTGLGLFVSYLIINQHHGTIEVESKLGVGTSFIIKLPIASKDEH
ncbi:MAG: ATP-binding protein [Anaerolineae bacterium]